MATGLNRLGGNAYTNSAIVQQAKKDWRYYEGRIVALDEDRGKLLKEYKEGSTWKEHYKTWTDACVPLDISRRQADRLIESEELFRTECPNVVHKKEEVALKKVEQARNIPHEPELEKPRVKTADEVIAEQREPEKPWAKTVEELPKRVDMHKWSLRLKALFDDMPKSEIHNKLTPESIKTFEGSITALRSLLPDLLELCKCGCQLSASMSELLWRYGIPCMGLTPEYAGMIRRKLEENEWRLPLWLEFAKNKGEWEERKFAGKPKKEP